MSDNKFILQLKGQQTPKSVVEIKNDKLVAPFVNVPNSSDAVGAIIPDKDSSVVVAKGAENWQLDGGALVPATNLTGNGADYTGEYAVSGSGLWVNAVYTFPSTGDLAHPVAEIFNSQTKWVLQLCGKNLLTKNNTTVDFSFIIKIGSSHIMTKTVTVPEQANFFCKRFVLDFSESEQSIIKASGGTNLTVQLLCADDGASATIYNGMTVLTALQRRIDASAVSASFANVEEVLREGIFPSDFFNNAEFMEKLVDGAQVFPIFVRDGDQMIFSGWRDNSFKKYLFSLTAGQTVLQFDENIEEKDINLYWNGQLITQPGNWNPSGDTITLSFEPEENDVIVVTTNPKFAVVNYVLLEQHNIDPNAHANIVSILNNKIDTANIDCGTL